MKDLASSRSKSVPRRSLESSPRSSPETRKVAATDRKRGKAPNRAPMTPRVLVTPAKKKPGTKKKKNPAPDKIEMEPPQPQVRVFKRGYDLTKLLKNPRGGTCRSCVNHWNKNYQFCPKHAEHLETFTQIFDGECSTLDEE
eukprot:scaffold4545_cov139-Amphora_coffeaeformis.AAC.8